MKYLGSKRRISQEIVKLMLSYAYKNNITTWVEPFVGGGNTIKLVPSSFKRIGIDINPHTIAALIGIRDHVDKLPTQVTKEEYDAMKGLPPDSITSWCRFVGSFGGKFEGGYICCRKKRNYFLEAKRSALRETKYLQGVELICGNYDVCSEIENAIIYCDIPYKNTTKYNNKFCGKFDYDKFYDWCKRMSAKNIVFISEYEMPEEFKCIWEKEVNCNIDNVYKKTNIKKIERLFITENNKII